ncbi:hypothetical protein BDV98DRAFT_618396, partial [Pterulicium gracile]
NLTATLTRLEILSICFTSDIYPIKSTQIALAPRHFEDHAYSRSSRPSTAFPIPPRSRQQVSPFSIPSGFSSSSVLLVSKQWMRVAAPLLYHDIVLRSSAQAQALTRALTRHKEFG